jgi:membrane peptidoglycan carboxypeptidase
MDAEGVKVAIKTGTSDTNKLAKDIWTVGYTPSISGTVWLGNPDTTPLTNGNSSIPAKVLDPVMAYAAQIYQKDKLAKTSDWFTAPAGIKHFGIEVYPSWYNKAYAQTGVKMTFDKVSKKKATNCTPTDAQISIDVTKTVDPLTKDPVYIAPDGYDATASDDIHDCNDVKPKINGMTITGNTISIQVTKGTFPLTSINVSVGGHSVASINVSGSGTYATNYNFSGPAKVTATLSDNAYYNDSTTQQYPGH